jgi:hypothetical protein
MNLAPAGNSVAERNRPGPMLVCAAGRCYGAFSQGGLAMITIKDAEARIIREWDDWAAKQSDPSRLRDGMQFFTHLQKQKSDLLDFRGSGDKWQAVHGWLLRNRRVKD